MLIPEAARLSWKNLKSRCDSPANPAYKNYGEKGITYDPTWENLTGFWADMGDTWFVGGTIDRVDSNKNYNKDNCQWILKADQTTVGRLSVRYSNKTGLTGVEAVYNGWRVIVRERGKPRGEGKKQSLYRGKDFFEACCVRKAWEALESKIPASSLT